MLRRIALGAVGAVVVSLVACGDGGSSRGGGSGSASTVQGSAAKGIISGALVEARRPNGSLINDAITDQDGHYSISLKKHHGPTLLILKPHPGAMVTCDVTRCRDASPGDEDTNGDGTIGFGERYQLDYELRAVVDVDKSASHVDAHITPLTTLVAARAGEPPTSASIAEANAFVKFLLGLDMSPGAVRPIDLTRAGEATDQELRYALLNAALEQLAQGSTVADLLAEFSGEVAAGVVTRSLLLNLLAALEAVEDAVRDGNTLLNVASAASGVRSSLEAAIHKMCGGEEELTCTPDIGEPPYANDNLTRAKALVAAARKISMEALASLDAELDGGYHDTLIPKIRHASTALDTDTRKVIVALGEVAAVIADQIVRTALDGSYPDTALGDAADLFFNRNRSSGCDWTEWDPIAHQACIDDNRNAYVSRFVHGTIVRDGVTWRVEDGEFDLDGDLVTVHDRVLVTLALSIPVLGGDSQTGVGLNAGANILHITGGASLGGDDISFMLDGGSRLLLELREPFFPGQPDLPQIRRIALDVNTVLKNSQIQFSGGLTFHVRAADRHSKMNNYPVMLPVPEKLELFGRFRDRTSEQLVGGRFVITVDNVDTFGFYQKGFIHQKLTQWSYDEETNTLTVTHGKGRNKAVILYTLGIEQGARHLDASCTTEGTGECLAESWRIPVDSVWLPTSLSSTDCVATLGIWSGDTCHVEEDASEAGLEHDIRLAFAGDVAREAFADIRVRIPSEGLYLIGPRHWAPFQLPTDRKTGYIGARLVDPVVEFDAEGRYLKGSVRVETYGKLSPRLPHMDISLVAARTGYDFGDITLLLKWDKDALTIHYPVTKKAVTDITIKDGSGTKLVLTVNLAKKTIKSGSIVKDGTEYGKLKMENGQALISWLDNTIETLY